MLVLSCHSNDVDFFSLLLDCAFGGFPLHRPTRLSTDHRRQWTLSQLLGRVGPTLAATHRLVEVGEGIFFPPRAPWGGLAPRPGCEPWSTLGRCLMKPLLPSIPHAQIEAVTNCSASGWNGEMWRSPYRDTGTSGSLCESGLCAVADHHEDTWHAQSTRCTALRDLFLGTAGRASAIGNVTCTHQSISCVEMCCRVCVRPWLCQLRVQYKSLSRSRHTLRSGTVGVKFADKRQLFLSAQPFTRQNRACALARRQ